VFKTDEQRSSSEIPGARGGYGYIAELPLKDVTPGDYVLRVEAASRLSGSKPVAREALVRVWAVPRPAPPAAATPPPRLVVNVARGPMSGVDAFRTTLARTDEEWQALWTSLPMRRAAPKVNFENTMIAAVFLGSRPTAGFGIEILDVKRDGDVLVVEYTERVPEEGTASATMITTPYAIAGIPMFAGEVRFQKVEASRP
jgi:hypothetical protein